MKYVGARYMPKFMGTYNATTDYEALSVVDNGMGTSYVTNKPAPAGTPLTDTNYWSVYGVSSGAILNLQNQIDEINDRYVTPEMYGTVGDGITDDSAAINDAISNASGKPVWFTGSKTYFCGSYITLANNTTLLGNGAHILFDPDGTLDQTSHIVGDPVSNIFISNLDFNFGNGTALRYGFSIMNSENITFEGCTFHNSYGYVFRLNYDEHVRFSGCRFHDVTGGTGNPGGAIYGIDWKHYIIDNCSCDTLDDHFIYITGESEDVKITKCTAVKCGQGASSPGSAYCIYADASNVVIADCSDIDCAKGGVHMAFYSGYTVCPHDILVTGHYSKNNGQNAIDCFADSSYRSENISIVNSTIESCAQEGISLRYVDNVKVIGVTIQNLTNSGRDPIRLGEVDGIVISECYLDNACAYQILIGNSEYYCQNILIKNNIFKGSTGYHIYARRISTKPVLTGNYTLDAADMFSGNCLLVMQPRVATNQKSITFGGETTDYHEVGDIVFNPTPSAGNPTGWICTAAGSPGTMSPFGIL